MSRASEASGLPLAVRVALRQLPAHAQERVWAEPDRRARVQLAVALIDAHAAQHDPTERVVVCIYGAEHSDQADDVDGSEL